MDNEVSTARTTLTTGLRQDAKARVRRFEPTGRARTALAEQPVRGVANEAPRIKADFPDRRPRRAGKMCRTHLFVGLIHRAGDTERFG
ncbi:hypothetical protein MB84_28700 (plasmid) [Pandoraea oxalativorans]|uniref:Uncharacterized protein n=1 Tax=Pandoraea oxalativorans TaxID=573737 RepID=A0A0G3IDT3_9BURK|nr:hypothetical protein MB84_28700 [Pandoraea oxalativorans]